MNDVYLAEGRSLYVEQTITSCVPVQCVRLYVFGCCACCCCLMAHLTASRIFALSRLPNKHTKHQMMCTVSSKLQYHAYYCRCWHVLEQSMLMCLLSVIIQVCLLLGLNCYDTLVEVFMIYFGCVSAQSQHASLYTDSLQLCCIEVICAAS